jgi:hypothetical protein
VTIGYLTRGALVHGIRKIEMEPRPGAPRMVRDAIGASHQYYILGAEVFETPAEAVRDAERLRAQRIAKLEREILNLRLLRF